MVILQKNNFPGLWQGPIDHKASSVINVIVNSDFLGDWVNCGDAVYVKDALKNQLLPAIDYISQTPTSESEKFYGIVVGGIVDGIYGSAGDEIVVVFPGAFPVGDVAGFDGDTVRVCTQGRCIARVDDNASPIEIGDPLTTRKINGSLQLAMSGDNVIARALQSASINGLEYIAVDVQREGKLM